MTYAEKLQSPKWQKKRLEIFTRDEWQCTKCGGSDTTLHVHHKTYQYGNEPWEYEDDNFITLCEKCHSKEEYEKTLFNACVKFLLKNGYNYSKLNDLLAYPYQIVTNANEQKGNQNG